LSIEDIAGLLDAACESVWSADKLRAVGERVWNLERFFNLNAGFTGADDTLPERMFAEATKGGGSTGAVSKLKAMLPEYYERRGWSEDGVPTADTLGRIAL
jgi:aldehyde:ferredoxin oxidoreductase